MLAVLLIPARHGRGRRVSGRHESDCRMVPGFRAVDRHGSRQCRHRGRRAASHRPSLPRSCSAAAGAGYSWPAASRGWFGRRGGGKPMRRQTSGRAGTTLSSTRTPWSTLLTYREVWGLVTAKFLRHWLPPWGLAVERPHPEWTVDRLLAKAGTRAERRGHARDRLRHARPRRVGAA